MRINNMSMEYNDEILFEKKFLLLLGTYMFTVLDTYISKEINYFLFL